MQTIQLVWACSATPHQAPAAEAVIGLYSPLPTCQTTMVLAYLETSKGTEMFIIGLGFTALLAQIVPIAWLPTLLMGGMHESIFNYSPLLYRLLSLAVVWTFYGVIVWFSLKKARLSSRLPANPPGKGWMVLGVILLVVYLVLRFYASTIQGGGPSMIVGLYAPYFLVPSRILLVVGAVEILLAASPDQTSLQARAARSEYMPRVLASSRLMLRNVHLWISLLLSLPAAASAAITIAYISRQSATKPLAAGIPESSKYYAITLTVIFVAIFFYSLTALIRRTGTVTGRTDP